MGAYLYLSSTQVTSVSPLLSTPVYRGHSGASISFSSKGQSFSSTDSLLPLTCSDNSHKVFFVRQDSRKFTLPGFPPPFPLVGVGTRLFLCFVISLLFATIYCWHQLIRLWFRLCNRLEANLTSSLIWKKCKLYLRETTCQPKGLLGPTTKQESRQNGLIYNVFFPLIIFYLSSFWQRLGFLPM